MAVEECHLNSQRRRRALEVLRSSRMMHVREWRKQCDRGGAENYRGASVSETLEY